MYQKTKYVMFWDRVRDRLEPVVFSESMIHADVARCMGRGRVVVSAGFVSMTMRDDMPFPSTHGRSDSLNIDTRPEDSTALAVMMGLSENLTDKEQEALHELRRQLYRQYGDN